MLVFKIITLSSNTRVPTMIPCSKYSGKLSLELPYESFVSLAFKKNPFYLFQIIMLYQDPSSCVCVWGVGRCQPMAYTSGAFSEMGTTILGLGVLDWRRGKRAESRHQCWFGWLLTLDAMWTTVLMLLLWAFSVTKDCTLSNHESKALSSLRKSFLVAWSWAHRPDLATLHTAWPLPQSPESLLSLLGSRVGI